ncbi:MAG: hypothetical protein HY785_03265 [Oscillatoriophycideae cyanobacterium NC_groundwater_1537_Pr4_S-0.65um_50_18]|nr:hypothetical protein [Oscillatoriophycideae cyanobacterium NC_groundwater_1537_Pr4_S-0.65um_50_18]
MSKESELSFPAVEGEIAPNLSAAQAFIKPSDRPSTPEASAPKPPILNSPTHLSSANPQRCLAHCWHTDQEWEQGQRCLVACWQNSCLQAEVPTGSLFHPCLNENCGQPSFGLCNLKIRQWLRWVRLAQPYRLPDDSAHCPALAVQNPRQHLQP